MEKLRRFLDLDWVYFAALDKQDQLVDQVIHFVEEQKSNVNATFIWPTGFDEDGYGTLFPTLKGKDWTTETVDGLDYPEYPLLCATSDNTILANSDASAVPSKTLLSRGMIASWSSHLRLLWHIVNETRHIEQETWDGQGVSIVFEDNIDVEFDLSKRLTKIWDELPRNWDLIMLGHCWSDEFKTPPHDSPLHPSVKPKCTNGYAVSPFGARRLLMHLSYPPYAFSRALDQAIAHLIETERIRSFSVVPSVVIKKQCFLDEECKVSAQESDTGNEEGRKGKESLLISALDMLERESDNGYGEKQINQKIVASAYA